MVRNLAKAPLIAVFYAPLMWFVVFFLPRSGAYREAAEAFTMPTYGLLMMVLYALVVAAAFALVHTAARGGGVGLLLMLALSVLGIQWLMPGLRQLMLGEVSGVMTTTDTVYQLLGGFLATLLTMVLAMLLYRGPQQAEPAKAPVAEPKFHMLKLGLVIRLLVLPVIYFVLYYLAWYFLFWRNPVAHNYHGVEVVGNFMAEFINVLINQGANAGVTLLTGLGYGAFCLPLLTRMQGKRVPYMASVLLLFLSGALVYLIPSPVMPAEVRMLHLVETGVLMLVYGLLSSFLMSTAYEQEELPEPAPAQQRTGARPAAGQQQGRPARQAAAK